MERLLNPLFTTSRRASDELGLAGDEQEATVHTRAALRNVSVPKRNLLLLRPRTLVIIGETPDWKERRCGALSLGVRNF